MTLHRIRELRVLITLIFGLASSAYAGAPLIIKQSEFRHSLSPYIEYYEDHNGKLTLDKILSSNYIFKFTSNPQSFYRFGFTKSAIWIRFKISNETDETREIIIEHNQQSHAIIDLFIPTQQDNNSHPQHFIKKSLRQETNSNDGSINHHYFYAHQISLPPQQTKTYFLRLESDAPINFSLHASSPRKYYQAANIQQTTIGLAMGIIFGLLIFNIFAYAKTDDIVYAAYSTHLIAILGFLASISGYLNLIIPHSHEIRDLITEGFIYLSLATGIILLQVFLETKTHNPIAHKILTAVTAFAFFGSFSVFANSHFTFHLISMLLIVAISVVVALTIIRGKENRMIRLYVITRSIIFLSAGICLLAIFALISLPFPIMWLILSAAAAESIFLTLLFIKRGMLQREKVFQNEIRLASASAETRAKGEFLAKISHEIRTPMNGVLGMTELLMDTPLTPNQKEFANTIYSSGSALLKILNDITDYSKIEAGRIELENKEFDLSVLLSECVDYFRSRVDEKNIELIIDIADDMPNLVEGDPNRLYQVLFNLISNAINFTDKGHVLIQVSPAHNSENLYLFEVIDTGVGIADHEQKNIFKLQPDDKDYTQNQCGGIGLGLTIASQLVQMMGGKIDVQSTLGKGSRFCFTTVLYNRSNENQVVYSYENKLKGLRLLVVDDNPACRQVLEQQAISWGMQVTSAVNGKEALALARTQANLEEPFHIVVLDHNMPGMSGLKLAAKINDDPIINNASLNNDVICIMLTGLSIAPTPRMARNAGIRRVLTKPVTNKALKIALAEELGHLSKTQEQQPKNINDYSKFQYTIRILVAEDHFLSQKVIKGMLAKLEIESHAVENGVKAIEALKTNHYDLILMDCDMPELDGFQATEKIREWEYKNNLIETPIIALTAHIMDEHRERSLRCGMNAHISKPVELAELYGVIVRWALKSKKPKLTLVETSGK